MKISNLLSNHSMNKKGIAPIIIILIIAGIIALAGGTYYASTNGYINLGFTKQAAFDPPSVCNPTNQNAVVTIEKTDGSPISYPCDAAYCVVSGYMNVINPSNTQDVIFRTNAVNEAWTTNNNWIAIKYDSNGNTLSTLQAYCWSGITSSGCSSSSAKSLLNTPNGQAITSYSGKICVGGRYFTITCGSQAGIDLTSTPKDPYKTNGDELYSNALGYSANWNFCPTNNNNFQFCRGTYQSVSTSGDHYTTGVDSNNMPYPLDYQKYKLVGGTVPESITFDPTYADGSKVLSRKLFIQRYDCSCQPAVDSGLACVAGLKSCSPTIIQGSTTCSSGNLISIATSYQCCNAFRGYGTFHTFPSGTILCGTGSTYGTCTEPTVVPTSTNYGTYLTCDTTKIFGESTCGYWGTVKHSCDPGNVCKLTKDGTTGIGTGTCGCASDSCTLHQRKTVGNPGGNIYDECIAVGTCATGSGAAYDYRSQTCPTPLIFDMSQTNEFNTLGACVCPTGGDECTNPSEPTTCPTGLSKKQCTPYYQSSTRTCYHDVESSCVGDQVCNLQTGSTCNVINKCNSTQIQCKSDGISYNTCATNGANTALDFRDLGGKCDSTTQQCSNNACITKPGCFTHNPDCGLTNNNPQDYDCITTSDSKGICQPKTSTGKYCSGTNQANTCTGDLVINECKQNVTDNNIYNFVARTLPSYQQCINGVISSRTTNNYCNSTSLNINPSGDGINYKVCELIANSAPNAYQYNPYQCSAGTAFVVGSKGISNACAQTGCQFNTTGMTCSNLKDNNNKTFETCINNVCAPITDIYFAGTNATDATICINNDIYKIQSYIGTSGTIKRWIKQTSCGSNICVIQ